MTLQQLQQPIRAEYDQFLREYHERISGITPILDKVDEHLAAHPGKRLRPLLLLLSAKACGTMTERHILLAVAAELLHNATLMHDDVVDESDTRRGVPSVRGRWGNQAAVLCGDYHLAQTMQILQQVGCPETSAIIAQTVGDMTRGELMQLSVTREQGTATLGDYLQIIELKTASLMAACCQLGAYSLEEKKASPESQRLRTFGLHYGIVFQLRDDLGSIDPAHDATLPQGIDAETLIGEHTGMALEAIGGIPPSEARDALCSLLLPTAPQPE